MKEKLLALLKTKFFGVREATLERLAAKKAETVTEESQLQTIVDGMTFDYIIDSESDFKGTQISKMAAVAEYEKRFGLKDGKPIEEPSKKKDHKPDPKAGDDPRDAQINELKESLNKLTELVTGVVTGQQKTSKQSQALDALKKTKIPEKLHQKWVNRIDFDSETSIEDQIKELEAEHLDIHQELIAQSVKSSAFVPGGNNAKPVESAELNSYLDDKFPKAAEGK